MTTAIDITQLPAPNVVQNLDYDVIFNAMLTDLRQRMPEFSALVAADPAYKILEVAAFRELLLRQQINDAARSIMVAYASGSDLDHLAALFGVSRQILIPGDPQAIPPRDTIYEDDDRLRQRIPLSLEGFSTAGPVGAYIFHALKASAEVKDVSVTSPNPGEVLVTVLSTQDNGSCDQDLIDTVSQQLNHEEVRPLTDKVLVQGATIITYQIQASLTFYHGPDRSLVMEQAQKQVDAYVKRQHKLGYDISLSGLYAALHPPGVQKVTITSPTQDLVIEPDQAAFCSEINLIAGGFDE